MSSSGGKQAYLGVSGWTGERGLTPTKLNDLLKGVVHGECPHAIASHYDAFETQINPQKELALQGFNVFQNPETGVVVTEVCKDIPLTVQEEMKKFKGVGTDCPSVSEVLGKLKKTFRDSTVFIPIAQANEFLGGKRRKHYVLGILKGDQLHIMDSKGKSAAMLYKNPLVDSLKELGITVVYHAYDAQRDDVTCGLWALAGIKFGLEDKRMENPALLEGRLKQMKAADVAGQATGAGLGASNGDAEFDDWSIVATRDGDGGAAAVHPTLPFKRAADNKKGGPEKARDRDSQVFDLLGDD